MIIFDLDGTLADCEHRRYLVDPLKAGLTWGGVEGDYRGNWTKNGVGVKWKPDYKAFNELCHLDKPIYPVVKILQNINVYHNKIAIWSGRCESQREKTEEWIIDQVFLGNFISAEQIELKMRPIGDNTPDEQLKERWLNERCKHVSLNLENGKTTYDQHDIDFVFDDRPKVIDMWRSRGIFVFNVNQNGKEF